jgi:maltokinase
MIDITDLSRVLVEHLPAHLARQRWAGAHDRPIRDVELRWHELVRDEEPMLLWTLARATFDDGGQQDYQLFVGVRPAAAAPDFLHGKERELIAAVATEREDLLVYDALVDPDLAIAVLHLVAPSIEVEVRRPIVLEHSNSSVVFDESSILKIFRKVEPGPNPDVEITRVLAERGYEHVLAPLAELQRDGTDLAVLREFLVGSTEGWELARASVRDLLAGGLPPEECGADFAPDAERLGAVLAGLHLAMAPAWGAEPGATAHWAADMEENLELVLSAGSVDLDAGAVGARFAELASLDDPGTDIRIHGDLHLAQMIKTDRGWIILDFEGEPARPLPERRRKRSPLRDVAGMLRSFAYAQSAASLLRGGEAPAGWEERARETFLEAYMAAVDPALLPAGGGTTRLLSVFELEKAVYELRYEMNNRPDWVAIPAAAIRRLLEAE